MKLTPHFELEEFTVSDTAERMGIANTPNAEIAAHLFTLACGLEKIRGVLGVPMRILSGYRCEQLERVLCNKDYAAWCSRHGRKLDAASWEDYFNGKAHPKGYAADFIAPAFGSPLAVVKKLQGSGIRFDQLIQEGSWVHVSFAPMMRQEVLTAHFSAGTGQPSYTRGV